MRNSVRIALAAATILSAVTLVPASPAGAVTGYHVVVGSLGLNARGGPGTGYPVVGTLVNGQGIDIACQTKGTLVGAGLPGTPTDVWDRLTNGWYVADYYTSTPGLAGGFTPGIPQCGAAPPQRYRRDAAAAWAVANVNNANGSPLFLLGTDCTYFVSQALWAGGLPRTTTWTNDSVNDGDLSLSWWKPGATKNAASADHFKNYVVRGGIATITQVSWSDNTAGGARPGDVVGYDWDGPDGVLDHLALVTSLNAQGYPTVTQHSPSRTRYWSWDPGNNNWIEATHPGARVYLLHITW